MPTCRWFALCDNEAIGTSPVTGIATPVPVCQRCADVVGLPAEEITLYE